MLVVLRAGFQWGTSSANAICSSVHHHLQDWCYSLSTVICARMGIVLDNGSIA